MTDGALSWPDPRAREEVKQNTTFPTTSPAQPSPAQPSRAVGDNNSYNNQRQLTQQALLYIQFEVDV